MRAGEAFEAAASAAAWAWAASAVAWAWAGGWAVRRWAGVGMEPEQGWATGAIPTVPGRDWAIHTVAIITAGTTAPGTATTAAGAATGWVVMAWVTAWAATGWAAMVGAATAGDTLDCTAWVPGLTGRCCTTWDTRAIPILSISTV